MGHPEKFVLYFFLTVLSLGVALTMRHVDKKDKERKRREQEKS
jgi:hypothetical protein